MTSRNQRGRGGFALAGLLLLVSTLALLAAYLGQSTGMGTHLAGSQLQTEKAFYAAEAATQEAVWQIKTNPAYMLARQGQWLPIVPRAFGTQGYTYQYRVLRRLDGIYRLEGRAVGSAAKAATLRYYDPSSDAGSTSGNVMLCYGREASSTPFCRFWESGTWSSPEAAGDTGSAPLWVVAASCPTREEKTLAVLDGGGRLSVQAWNGTVWSAVLPVATLGVATRGFDLAYETLSGRAMLVWQTSPATLGYLRWDGNSWSGPFVLNITTGGTPRWVRLRPNPRSNELLLAWATEANQLGAAVWNGAAFGNMTILEGSLRTSTQECFALAYEPQSGRAMAVWQPSTSNWLSYRLWSGVWGVATGGPNAGAAATYIRAGGDPASSRIIVGTLDTNRDVNVWVWSGAAFGSHQEVETNAQTATQRCFDVSFTYPGGQALVAWGRSGNTRLRYRIWGDNWTSAKDGPDVGSNISLVQLVPDPYSQRLFAQVENTSFALRSVSWDGRAWDGSATSIEALLPGAGAYEPFMLTSGYSDYGVIYSAGIEADNRDAVSINNNENTNGVSMASRQDRFGVHTSGGQVFQSGLEFRLGIPAGAVIKEAYLTLTSDENNYTGWDPTGPFSANIYVMDRDDAPVFNTLHNHDILHHASCWDTTVDWAVEPWEPLVQYRTPNLAALVSHVMARGGWATGNYIGFAIDEGNATGSSFRGFEDYTTAPQQAAKLTVIYSLP